MRRRILEEELISYFTDLRKQSCAFDELEREFSSKEVTDRNFD